MPERIQRKRTAGWKMPVGALYVGRPTKWGNPYQLVVVGTVTGDRVTLTVDEAITKYEEHLRRHPELVAAARVELRGHDLACWCGLDHACHADVLLRVANEQDAGES